MAPTLCCHDAHHAGPSWRCTGNRRGLVIVTTAYAPADWTNFGLATAGTAATLAGLLNVWVLLVEILR